MAAAVEAQRRAIEAGMSPDQVADCVFPAIADGREYILTHPEVVPVIEARMNAIVNGRNPMDLRTVVER